MRRVYHFVYKIQDLVIEQLVRTVSGDFRREKVVQTVTWLSYLPKKFAIRLDNESVNVECSNCKSTSHGLSRYSIDHVLSYTSCCEIVCRRLRILSEISPKIFAFCPCVSGRVSTQN